MAVTQAEMVEAIRQAESVAALEQLRVAYLGRKGSVTELLKAVGALPAAERAAAGQAANAVRQAV
ncbi:MAG TPA: phenylalanine--tRNA ligase subunit alpha, partial [Candidatus Saccharimonadia bacterium]